MQIATNILASRSNIVSRRTAYEIQALRHCDTLPPKKPLGESERDVTQLHSELDVRLNCLEESRRYASYLTQDKEKGSA